MTAFGRLSRIVGELKSRLRLETHSLATQASMEQQQILQSIPDILSGNGDGKCCVQ